MQRERDDDKFYTSQLFGKTANIFYDMHFEAIKDTSNFKASIVGDPIDGQFKNQPIFTFSSYAKQIYSTNRIPKSKEDTYAWFRRWVLLHFKNRVPKHLQDKDIISKLTTPQELSGILNLALAGLKLLIKEGEFETGAISETKRICEGQASLVNNFLQEGGYDFDVGNELFTIRARSGLYKAT
jgi:phage/plasmid-associated DNA primase